MALIHEPLPSVKPPIRRVLAVALGVAVCYALHRGADWLLPSTLFWHYPDMGYFTLKRPLAWALMIVLTAGVASLVGGLAAALAAPDHRVGHAVATGLLAATWFVLPPLRNGTPLFGLVPLFVAGRGRVLVPGAAFYVAVVVPTLLGAALGGALAQRLVRSRGTRDPIPADERPTEHGDEVGQVSGHASLGDGGVGAGNGPGPLVVATLLSAAAMIAMWWPVSYVRCLKDACYADLGTWADDSVMFARLVAAGLIVFTSIMAPVFVLHAAARRKVLAVELGCLAAAVLVGALGWMGSPFTFAWRPLASAYTWLAALAAAVLAASVALFSRTVLRSPRSVLWASWLTMLVLGAAILAWAGLNCHCWPSSMFARERANWQDCCGPVIPASLMLVAVWAEAVLALAGPLLAVALLAAAMVRTPEASRLIAMARDRVRRG